MGKIQLAGQQVLPATPAEIAKYHANYGWEVAGLHGESSRLLNVNGNPCGDPPQVGYPSVYQGLPLTADLLLRWLGGGAYPAGWGVGNVLAIYNCNTASPLVDSLGLGPNLVAAGGPLTGRECVGLGQAGSFASKVGCEFQNASANAFNAALAAFADPNGTELSLLMVVKHHSMPGTTFRLFAKRAGADPSWMDSTFTDSALNFYCCDGVGFPNSVVNGDWTAWHCIALVVDDLTTKTNSILSDLGDNTSAAWAGNITNATFMSLGTNAAAAQSAPFQIAYFAVVNRLITSAMRAAFWRHARLPAPYAYGMANPLVAPIAASRVACWAGGNTPQVPVGYHANLVSAARGNALGTGYPCEDGASFLGIRSDDLSAWAPAGVGQTETVVDGPSGMRDALRILQGGNFNAGVNFYEGSPGATIAGATNVAFAGGCMAKQATVGTTLRYSFIFIGDAGGAETFSVINSGATTASWARYDGTCTPIRPAHTQLFAQSGANLNAQDVDFAEPYAIQNRATAPLAWRRVGNPAAAATSTPTYQLTNTANRYYNPLRGQIRLVIGGFQLTNGAVFLQFGAAAAAGSLTLDYNAGQLRLRIWDATPALAATVLCGALDATEWRLVISYDSQVPVRDGGNANVVVERINPGAPTTWLGASWGAWTAPTAAVLALYFGSAAGANAARCYLAEA